MRHRWITGVVILMSAGGLAALLHAARPGAQWFLIIGQDQHAGFHTWHGWRRVNVCYRWHHRWY